MGSAWVSNNNGDMVGGDAVIASATDGGGVGNLAAYDYKLRERALAGVQQDVRQDVIGALVQQVILQPACSSPAALQRATPTIVP